VEELVSGRVPRTCDPCDRPGRVPEEPARGGGGAAPRRLGPSGFAERCAVFVELASVSSADRSPPRVRHYWGPYTTPRRQAPAPDLRCTRAHALLLVAG